MKPSVLAAVMCGSLGLPGSASGSSPNDWIGSTVEPILRDKRIPGAVVGILRGNELVTRRGFGMSDVENQTPMEADTLFQIGSVTKPMTASLAALLHRENLLDVDAPIGVHLPEDEDIPKEILHLTVRQLATHTSGLPREPVNRRNVPDSPSVMLPYSTEELYEGLRGTELERTPGEEFSYSNLGYLLLGHVLELATDKDYRTLLSTRLFEPLAMSESGVDPSPEHERRLAVHYWPEDEVRTPRPRWEFGEIAGAAGVYSSAQDLAMFLAAQYSSNSILVSSREMLHQPQVEIAAIGRRMSAGWFIDQIPGLGQVLGYGGEVDGHSACVMVAPSRQAGLVVLCNQGGDSAEALCRALMPGFIQSVLAGGMEGRERAGE